MSRPLRPLQPRTIGPVMPSHAALITAITGSTILGWTALIVYTHRKRGPRL